MSLILLALWFVQSAYALDCLVHFSSASELAAPADGIDLVKRTYNDLLDTLGTKLNERTIQKLIESGKPFEIPEQADADLYALRTNLAKFERMVAQKGWEGVDTSAALLQTLRERSSRGREARPRVDQAKEMSRPDLTIEFPSATGYQLSPDGRYLYSNRMAKETKFYSVHDLKTAETYTGDSSVPGLGPGTFGTDGKTMLFSNYEGTFFRIPFENGRLLFPDAVVVPGAATERIDRFQPTANPDRIVFVGPNLTLRRFDFKTRQSNLIRDEQRRKIPLREPGSWGMTPQGGLFTLVLANGRQVVREFELAADGTARETNTRPFPRLPHLNEVVYAADGKNAVTFGFGDPALYVSTANGREPLDLAPRLAESGAKGAVRGVQFDPHNGDILVLTAGPPLRMSRFDGTSFQWKSGYDLRGPHSHMRITPDGEKIIYSTKPNELVVTLPANRE